MVKKSKERALDLGHALLVQNAELWRFVDDPITISKTP